MGGLMKPLRSSSTQIRGMTETWGDVVKKLKAISEQRGKPITEKTAQAVIEREYSQLFNDGYDPLKPAPEISAEEYENMADLTDLEQ
jgi:hypothetical protein